MALNLSSVCAHAQAPTPAEMCLLYKPSVAARWRGGVQKKENKCAVFHLSPNAHCSPFRRMMELCAPVLGVFSTSEQNTINSPRCTEVGECAHVGAGQCQPQWKPRLDVMRSSVWLKSVPHDTQVLSSPFMNLILTFRASKGILGEMRATHRPAWTLPLKRTCSQRLSFSQCDL